MKKYVLTALMIALLALPLGSVALADHEEASAPTQSEYTPGSAPAASAAADAMSPALHGMVLAALNNESNSFDLTDQPLVWEGLYNMLSLYGQLDSRTEVLNDGAITFPAETVWDYAAALAVTPDALGSLPAQLADRLTYDKTSDSYQAVCGSDDLAQIQILSQHSSPDALHLTGALVYLVDNTQLAQFQATLRPADNMFGYTVTNLTLN